MKIGIHESKGSFSERWISYCEKHEISYKTVNCYHSDIIQHLKDCDALMWHFHHKSPRDSKFAKQLLYSVQAADKSVFPGYQTAWHFDDKVGQKYLLESIEAPLVPSYVFYSRQEALEWADQTRFPKVFKLRNGAGSDNVRLVKSKAEAYSLIRKAFGKGFRQYAAWSNLKERYRMFRLKKTNIKDLLKGLVRLLYTTEYAKVSGREVGYVYFQDFIPDNDHDIRVVVVGDKAFALKRMIRENDFRASGSGSILYEKKHFDDETVRISFEISDRIKAQCMTFDFVYLQGSPLVVEISYGFTADAYDACTGYWDKKLTWHEGRFNPYGWMVEDLLKNINKEIN